MRSSMLFILMIAAPLSAQATLQVPGSHPTIQQAIAAASDGDTVLVAPGTYVEQIDFLGKAITVMSAGGSEATTIDSQGMQGWPDFPYAAVVRMVQGEGPDSILDGFTVTGVNTPPGTFATPGIWCAGPTIRDCIIAGNRGGGGGVRGSPILERCTIVDNSSTPYDDGGGVYGQPVIVDCIIRGNQSGGRGGGLYATGPCIVINTIFDHNVAGTGPDGYSGGGVFGPALLVDCQITRNSAHHYLSGGPPDEIGTGVDGAAGLIGCTVAYNFVAGGAVPGETSGGIKNVVSVQDSILWGNESHDVALGSSPTITYSIVGGGYPGEGNLALNPAFLDIGNGDYFLTPASPAIDAANPASPLDPDGTRADMGAYYFPQFSASSAVRNGTGVNPLCFSSILKPFFDSTWTASVDATAHGFTAGATVVIGSLHPLPPIPLAFGELLISPEPILFTSVMPVVGGLSIHKIPIPPDYSLGGLLVPTQAAVVGVGVGFCNAIDLSLGI